jgi:hypothetical protein
MRKSHLIIVLLVCLVLLPLHSFESAPSQPFDLKKCRQELEIMKGILRTTLGFASKELIGASARESRAKEFVFFRGNDFSSIGAFYLAGQGAVFTIPASGIRESFKFGRIPRAAYTNFNFDFDSFDDLREQIEILNEQLRDGFGLRGPDAITPEAVAAFVPPVPPVPAAPSPRPEAAPKPPQAPRTEKETQENMSAKEKELRSKLSELQEKVKKKGEEEEARAAKFRESLQQLKVFLVEALANHADSLTTVKPNEYVNLVITDENGRWLGDNGERAQREVLSVQKSVITDYKAGKLTLDAFKQKVMDYMN